MAVYTETKTYHTRAHMGMIDVTEDFQQAITGSTVLDEYLSDRCSLQHLLHLQNG